MGISKKQIIIVTAFLFLCLSFSKISFLPNAQKNVTTVSLTRDKVAKLQKLDNYCGWRGKNVQGIWVEGEAYVYFDKKEAEKGYKVGVDQRALFYILANKGYVEVDSFTLTPCLYAKNGKKIYYGDIVSFNYTSGCGDYCFDYFKEGDTINIVANSQICYTNEHYYHNGPECQVKGYIIKDGVPPIKSGDAPISYYPKHLRNKLPVCDYDPNTICLPFDKYPLPGYEITVDNSFKVIGNIYDNKELLNNLSGLGKNAEAYFTIPMSDIGSIPKIEYDMP